MAPTEAEIGRSRSVEVGLVGDAASVLGQLESARERPWTASNWRDELEAAQQEGLRRLLTFERTDDVPIHPLRLTTEVCDLLDDGASVAIDGELGQWARWAAGSGRFTTILNGKLGGIGPSIPFAIAARSPANPLLRGVPRRRHVRLPRPGARYRRPLPPADRRDRRQRRRWAAERHRQRQVYGEDRVVASDLLPTRYDRVAEALGCHAEHVKRVRDQLRPPLERAFSSGKPACLNVAIASIPSPSATQ